MIINEKLNRELLNLQYSIDVISRNHSLTDLQVEKFLRDFEKARYNLLSEIKLHNNNVEFDYEKIKTIDREYKAELTDNILKIYIPEVMPSYKNIKTHAHKRILLNIAEVTKQFKEIFDNEVLIYIKVFDKIQCWDIDNKFIKPISDGLILSKVIKDDNITKMFYCAKGEYSEKPHTEVYIFDSKNINKFLDDTIAKSVSN